MRASSLYSFASKPENQQTFGLQPYVNPNNSADSGAYFEDVYATFQDSYTLVNALKEGWYNEDGGFAYYIAGQRLYGIQEVEGYYYDFGENGVNVGQTKYTGLFFDEFESPEGEEPVEGEEPKGVWRYAVFGLLQKGWHSIDGNWHYFSSTNYAAVTGDRKVGGIPYSFEENGKLITGTWVTLLNGTRYYGPSYYTEKWREIDGEWYYFVNGYRVENQYRKVGQIENTANKLWYDFGADGASRGLLPKGLYEIDGKLYYIIDGKQQVGLHKVNGEYYFFLYEADVARGIRYYAWETHCDLPCSNYYFNQDGTMANGLTQMEDGLYYCKNGKTMGHEPGLTKIGDDYYFVASNGRCAKGPYYCWATRCELPVGNYEFGEDCKALNGIVEKSDGHYYYINGKKAGSNPGLTKIGDDYYFVATNSRCATGKYYCWATNCDLKVGNYEFGSDGKMLTQIVIKEDGPYYYIKGRPAGSEAGLTKVGNDYYFVSSSGRCATGEYYCWATNCDLPVGTYEFGTDGKALNGVIEKNDGYYYYINGRKAGNQAGLTKIGNSYYFVASNGRCATGEYYCWATRCDLPTGTYVFGSDGKALHGILEIDGGIYCYVNGQLGGNMAGLNKIGNDYYFITTKGKIVTGSYYCWATKCDLPVGTYEFGDDGKMLDGFVHRDGEIYLYNMGKTADVGLYRIKGYYYFVTTGGKLVRNQSYYVWKTNGLLHETTYVFNDLGQIIE